MKQALLCFFILFFLCCIVAPSQAHNFGQYTSRFSVEEGLSQSAITAITQDKHGFIWIGTLQGLNRYDGNQLVSIAASKGLDEQEIVELFNISSDELLISTGVSGAFLLNVDDYTVQQIYDGKRQDNNTVSKPIATAIGHRENIIFSIESDLYTLDRNTLKSELLTHFKPSSYIRAINVIGNFVIIGTTEGLFTYSLATGNVEQISYTDSKSELSHDVKLLKRDPSLGLLVGTVEGLFVIPVSNQTLIASKSYELVPEKNIWGHQITPYGEFIATEHGLFIIDRRKKTSSKVLSLTDGQYRLTNPSITELYADRNNNLWMGTYNDGAYLWPSSSLRFASLISTQDRFANNNIWSIHPTNNNTVLLGTDNGINEFDLSTHQLKSSYLQNRDSKALYGADAVFSILNSSHFDEHTFLIQTAQETALFNTDTKQLSPITLENGDKLEPYSWGIAKYSEHKFPFINSNGFYEYDAATNTVRALKGLSKQLAAAQSFLILPPLDTTDGEYWISTDISLVKYNESTDTLTTIYNKSDKHLVSAVNSWVVDRVGTLWLATSTEGLVGINKDTYAEEYKLTTEQGLLSNAIYNLLLDRDGMIWASSQRGMFKFDPISKVLETFGTNQGLPTLEFNGGAAAALESGKLMFGTVNGSITFDPEQFSDSSVKRRSLLITQMDILSRGQTYLAPDAILQALDFKFDDMGIELQFSDFDFNADHHIQYQASLNGPSALTFSSLKRNKVFLNQLLPGDYQLIISPRSLDRDDLSNALNLRFNVAHSPWRSPLALIVYSLSAFAFILLIIIKHKQKQRQLETALRAVTHAGRQTKLALKSTKSGVWSADLVARQITQQRAETLGFESDTMTLQEHYNAIHPDDRELVERAWKKFISNPTNEQLSLSYRLRCADNNWHWFHDFGQVAEFDSHGKAKELHGIYTNVTTQKANQMRANMLGEAFSQVNDWILILDPNLQPISVNSSFCRAFQLQENEALNDLTTERFVNAIGQKKFHGLIANLKSLGPNQYLRQEVQVTDGWDKVHPVQLSISAVSKDNVNLQYFVVVVTDLTEQKKAENELRYLANFDALTELPNRSLMLQHIEFALFNANNTQQSCALLFIDLDKFKPINDAYGHHIGDKLLVAITKRIQEQINNNCILARQSGDEFLVLIKSFPSIEYVSEVVTRLVKHIPERIEIDGITMSVSASIGIAVYPFDAPDSESLIRNADIAMIHAKQSGRNAFKFFTESMNEEISKKLRLETAMKTAVKDGEFFNHYQPIINTTTGQLAGVELLMRWQNNDMLVPPCDFIPIAEESGLIETLTEQALIRALIELRPLFKQEPEFYLSLNLSAVHILRSDIAHQFTEILKAHGLTNRCLRLEITESIFMSDMVKARATINEMKRADFVLLLDDFGTGFSSLTYLNEFPLDIIKIDQGFVRNMSAKPANKSIIRTIYLLAQSLNMKCIAEGVETESQLNYLRDVGCEYMQGYHFAKPMAIDDLLAFYEQHERSRA
ncbi:EAL domain-containing protein [Pseudoalteromonas piscicida]|uniref:EAL domain-containing protein n=1 Tax=Pseudoalteromonas piscicida TaxID=43662 RepID=A0AAD0W5S2_PSEO7|nr:EAL domain-containing protein [Pseudoalteromonas piscicida]ASD68989.1 GGDEF-domain containing protein [Pseudoalteromonas piscicida]AXR04639.1 EAL domain-containing protein [Pseudoalteromonas piscicida]